MQKVVCVAAALLVALTASCGVKNKNIDAGFDAKAVFTQQDAEEILTYEPKMTFKDGRFISYVRYNSEPLGQDPIIVELYSEKNTDDTAVYAEFEKKRAQRADRIDVTDIDAEAFIAYPSMNIYKNGCMAVITAGSGATDEQKELLVKIGDKVVKNLGTRK